MTILTEPSVAQCDYCGIVAEFDLWLPERYAADGYCPSSFSAAELIQCCHACSTRYNMTHNPDKKRTAPAVAPFGPDASESSPATVTDITAKAQRKSQSGKPWFERHGHVPQG